MFHNSEETFRLKNIFFNFVHSFAQIKVLPHVLLEWKHEISFTYFITSRTEENSISQTQFFCGPRNVFYARVRSPICMYLKCSCFKIIFYVDYQTIRIVADVMSVQLQAQFDHCSHALAQDHHIESK
jgi:hypothetical protein